MVTVSTTYDTDEMKTKPRPDKQVQINTVELHEYIELISERVRQNSLELHQHASELDPPYPLEAALSRHHQSQLEIVCHSTLLKLFAEMKSLSDPEWEICIAEYMELKSPNPGDKDRYKDFESPAFSPEMLALIEKIGLYLETQDPKPPYLRRKNTISHRVVTSMAIIWLGRKLRAEKLANQTAN